MNNKFNKFFKFITSINEEIILNETYLMANKKYSIKLEERKVNYKNIKGKIKEKYSSKGFDLEEEKHIVNANILNFDKKNDDSQNSAFLVGISIMISIIIPFLCIGFFNNSITGKILKDGRIELISHTNIVQGWILFLIVAIYMISSVIYIMIMRFANSDSICKLNFYKICLEALEEVEKEIEKNKAKVKERKDRKN